MSIELNLSTEEFKDAPFLDKFEIQMECKKRKVQIIEKGTIFCQ